MSALKKLGILKHFKIWISTFGMLTSCTSQACKSTGLEPNNRHSSSPSYDVATQPNYFNFKIAVTRIAFWFFTSSNKPSINDVFLLLNGLRFNLSRWSRFPASRNERPSQDKERDRPGFPRNSPGSLSASRRSRCSGRSSLSAAFGSCVFSPLYTARHGRARPLTYPWPSGSAQGPAAQRTHLQVTCLVLMAAGTRAGVALKSQGLHRRGPARPRPRAQLRHSSAHHPHACVTCRVPAGNLTVTISSAGAWSRKVPTP